MDILTATERHGKLHSIGLSAREADEPMGLRIVADNFNSIFDRSYVILWDRNNFCAILFALSPFVFTLCAFPVVSCMVSGGLLLKFHYTPVF